MNICTEFQGPRSIVVIIWTRFGLIYHEVDGHCDLELWWINLKIDRDLVQFEIKICTEFGEPMPFLSSYHLDKVLSI